MFVVRQHIFDFICPMHGRQYTIRRSIINACLPYVKDTENGLLSHVDHVLFDSMIW
jgi:hypothetical protein